MPVPPAELMVQELVDEETVTLVPATMNWPFVFWASIELLIMEFESTDLEVMSPAEMSPALRDPNLVPPLTVNPVVVAFPKLVLLVTLMAPKLAPPVTLREVVVAAPATKLPSNVPPFTDRPVVVAFWKRELPETVSAPPKYTLPVELTERRLPGVVVPMPILPSLLTNNNEEVADVMFNAGVLPVALETLTERTAEREVEAMPTLPVASILILSVLLVEKVKAVLALFTILNWPESLMIFPDSNERVPVPTVRVPKILVEVARLTP